MSLRKKTIELKRLKEAFEREAQKFYDLHFSKLYIFQEDEYNVEDCKFDEPNHCIKLWEYYGHTKDSSSEKITQLINSSKDYDPKWGIRGAELVCFGVLEGEALKLFLQMGQRAGNLFNKEEAYFIKTRIINGFAKPKGGKPIYIINDNTLAIWLNFLLYYVSQTHPAREMATKIQPDPFTLSLIALEDLINDPIIGRNPNKPNKLQDMDFKVALSFPGEKRDYVSKVADNLRSNLAENELFYDSDFRAQLARPNLDTFLQRIYKKQAKLIIVFLCAEYDQKEWCGLEWRVIRDIIKTREEERIMFVRFDNVEVEGALSIDGYIDANESSPSNTAKLILERIDSLS